MSYLLPRAFILVIVWAMTCALIKNLWPDADPMAFGAAGLFWVAGGMSYFVYLRKLRRDIADLERSRRYSFTRPAG